ncbi:hypothetical protein GOBAR_DD21311 [Gossypium barbadense]|nr:hypothetical protein GOBAR_DD21311 [Gossypium barbadense]
MKLVDNEDMETTVALYYGNRSDQNVPIQLFAELAGLEPIEDPTPLGEEHGAQESCMVVPISYVDSQSTDSSDPSDHDVDSDSYANMDEVSDDIDDEGVNDNGNVNASSVENQIQRSVIHNNPGAHMSLIDPDTAHAAEFSKYPEIILAHRLVVDSDPKELFVGQRFEMVKDMLTIKVSVLIVEMQARFQYRVSYCKAWIAKQMTIEQLYRDFDGSYNELHGWIAVMREYVPKTVIELQTRPYYDPDDQLQPRKRIFQQMF